MSKIIPNIDDTIFVLVRGKIQSARVTRRGGSGWIQTNLSTKFFGPQEVGATPEECKQNHLDYIEMRIKSVQQVLDKKIKQLAKINKIKI